MHMSKLFKKTLSLIVCLAMVLSYLPQLPLHASAADQMLNIVSGSKKADPSTIDGWEAYFGSGKMDTEFAGAVWTDKSVFDDESQDLPGVRLDNDNNFLVSLSAIASGMSITGHTSAPTDTMLVLDLSGSMVDDTYEVGTIRQGNSYQTAEGIDMSLIEAMIEATNATIDTLMKQNTNSRVGVVLYSGNTSSNQDATASTATVVLPLGRYAGIDGEYLSVDTTYREEALYRYVSTSWFGGSWQATGQSATYVPEGTAINVSVKNGLKTESGGTVADRSKQVTGGTYIQNGLYQAMNQFLSVTDTVVPEGRPQAGLERMPVLVLMSDGAPTIATTSYTNIGNSNTGDGTATNDRITFLTQLTAAYVRGRVASHYRENADDEKDVLFLTLGLGTENSSAATNTLYPAGSNSTLVGYWNNYLRAAAGQNVDVIDGSGSLNVRREADVAAMNYVDTYYYANNAQDLISSFADIASEIALKAESYVTLVEGSSADFSGYVTFEDSLGEMMHVADVKGVLMSDGRGGKVLYTGKGVAESMNAGNLGTVDQPNARGDELVRTVQERIPGTTTTQAQQLIGYAYNDRQLYYADDNNWSNYIGWYADADGNYVGFWDKDSGYENAPQGAVYANRSYGYLGVNGDSDMMHVVVMVRTELATMEQSVLFKIPASLLPTVQYKVTLDEDDPTQVKAFEREGAIPMQLVFEVGLRPDINSVNLNQKVAEHIAKGGHVHRNNDGTVTFYTNEWAIGNDKNQNGIPDPEEVDSAIVAQSHFHPALDNNRFYYTDNTVILTGNGSAVTGATRPSDTDSDAANGTGYYYNRYIYAPDGRKTIRTPIAATTLANDARYDAENGYWYIPEGTMYHNLARFQTAKTSNTTDTLSYSFFPAVFDSVSKQDVYTFLGNNGSFTVAPAQGIVLTKTIAEVSQDQGAPTEFTFTVTLSQAVEDLLITDTDGNLLTGIADVVGNEITVTLKADQTVVISGIPTGTTYTVEEAVTEYYSASSVNATGTVEANTLHAVDFVNTAKSYGSLVVSKDVNYPQGFLPGTAHSSKEFPIVVTFTGDITAMVAPQGAVRDGNTFTLMLRSGQSATFTNIPEGVTYTVAEGELSAGYELQDLRYSDQNKKIDGKDLDQAHVVNRYTLKPVHPNVKIRGDKTLVTNEGSWNGAQFTVELLRIDNFADEEPTPTGLKATMTESSPSYEIDLSSIQFTAAGTYYFCAAEVIPQDRNENIAYDRTFGLFSITVGDANADGELEIQDVRAYQNTGISGNNEDGVILEKDFTNVVTTDRIYLDIQKHVTDALSGEIIDAHMGNITFGLFTDMSDTTPAYYTLTDTHGKATLMIPVTKEAVQSAPGGELVYYMREIAPAVENRVVGMNYDASWIYAISISWNEQENQAVVQYAPIENDQIGAYTVYTEGSVTFEHTNTYESNVKVAIDLTGSKTLNGGNALGGRAFSFSLYESTAAFVVGNELKTVSNNGNAISFEDITFTAPGVYYMVAKENASTLGGITIDPAEYHITVEIEKYSANDGTTGLRLVDGYPTVVLYGTSEDVGIDGLDFNNIYTVTGSDQVTIGGKKVLNGRALVAGEFTIGLYSDAACTQQIETVTNRADGTFSFSTITYTAADLGEGHAAKTYTYYIKEVPGSKGGVTYDSETYTVTVKLSHEDGVLVATPSNNATTLRISNTYKASSVTVPLRGSKALSGDWTAVANKDFTFQLFKADSGFTITDTDPVKTATVTGNDSFTMNLSYSDGQEGIYYYVLKEDISARAGGVGYDAGEYHITVNVSDPGDGHLVAITTMYRPGTGNVSSARFTNAYTVEPTSITLEGAKRYMHSVTEAPMTMEAGMFSFLVLEGEHLVATGRNLTDGTIEFTPIRYTAAGVHTYTVVELPGDAGGIGYDETVFTVTVTVTDNGNGTLTAAADYNGTPVVFENTYTHQAAQVTFNGEKRLSGDWSAVPAANKLFNFQLYKTGSDFAISGEPIDVTTAEAGAFTFGAQTYTTEGTYYYVILEHAGAAGNGITYSDTKYQITVEVDDNGFGKLIPTVTAEQTGVTVTADATDSGILTVDGMVFTNHYAPALVKYAPVVHKRYEREATEEMKQFSFVLTVDGNDKQTKQNDSQGKVTFDELTFEEAGVYELKIREQENILWGLIRWDINVYTIALHVEDNGLGQLVINEAKTQITSDKGDDDLIFRNAHHDVITEKEVFVADAPNISVDGKAVATGDILVYKISYTNYDSVPVDVEITDVIPRYTTFVSAENGGALTGDTVKWTVRNVAPGATETVSFQVKVAEVKGSITNIATVLEGNNRYYTNETATQILEPKLSIHKLQALGSGAATVEDLNVKKGNEVTYTLTVTNNGEGAAFDVVINDVIPEGLQYVADSANLGGVFAGGKLTWNVDSIAAGGSVTLTFKVKVPSVKADTSWTNVAQLIHNDEPTDSNEVTIILKVPTNPVTGDDFQIMTFVGMMILSSFGLAAVVIGKKRAEEEETV